MLDSLAYFDTVELWSLVLHNVPSSRSSSGNRRGFVARKLKNKQAKESPERGLLFARCSFQLKR